MFIYRPITQNNISGNSSYQLHNMLICSIPEKDKGQKQLGTQRIVYKFLLITMKHKLQFTKESTD